MMMMRKRLTADRELHGMIGLKVWVARARTKLARMSPKLGPEPVPSALVAIVYRRSYRQYVRLDI